MEEKENVSADENEIHSSLSRFSIAGFPRRIFCGKMQKKFRLSVDFLDMANDYKFVYGTVSGKRFHSCEHREQTTVLAAQTLARSIRALPKRTSSQEIEITSVEILADGALSSSSCERSCKQCIRQDMIVKFALCV